MKLVDQFKLLPVAIEVPTALPLCNPSILATGTGWMALVRGLDPAPYEGPDQLYLSSENWLIHYDAFFRPLARVKLQDENILSGHPEARNGLEDGRLFEWNGKTWALFSGLRWSRGEYFNVMVLARIESDQLVDARILPSPHGHSREKNWMPWVLDGELHLVYSTCPQEIYRYGGGKLEWVHSGPSAFKTSGNLMSGSSQVIPWGNDYLAITHQRCRAPLTSRLFQKYVTRDPDYRRKKVLFSHYFLLFDRHFNIKARSGAFRFETDGIEFCAGLACRDQRVVASYGVMDEKAHLIELDPSMVDRLLGLEVRPRNLMRIVPPFANTAPPQSLDLIVLNYRNFKTTAALCLDSLRTGGMPGSIHIQLLDNGSPDSSPAEIREYARTFSGLDHECLPVNLGFAGGMNHAADKGSGDWLLLVNNDTLFLPGSLEKLSQALNAAPADVGAIGPVTNAAGNEQDYFLAGSRAQILESARIFNDKPVGRLLPVYRLDFFCVAIRRKLWDQLGGLDVTYGLGYYEDFDFSVRARYAGYRLMMCEDAFVYHQGGGSFKQSATTKQLIRKNRDLFSQRYPEVHLPHKREGNLTTLMLYQELIESGYPAEQLSERIVMRRSALEREMPRSFHKRLLWNQARSALRV